MASEFDQAPSEPVPAALAFQFAGPPLLQVPLGVVPAPALTPFRSHQGSAAFFAGPCFALCGPARRFARACPGRPVSTSCALAIPMLTISSVIVSREQLRRFIR